MKGRVEAHHIVDNYWIKQWSPNFLLAEQGVLVVTSSCVVNCGVLVLAVGSWWNEHWGHAQHIVQSLLGGFLQVL